MNRVAGASAPRFRERRSTKALASASSSAEPPKKGTAKIQRISPENSNRVNILSEALPYLQRFQGQTVVVKYGGAAMQSKELKAAVIRDICLLATVGINIVLVHGGGPEINKMLEVVGIEPNFKNGWRVTDDATMEEAMAAYREALAAYDAIHGPPDALPPFVDDAAAEVASNETSPLSLIHISEPTRPY